jgi:hypothetical protein
MLCPFDEARNDANTYSLYDAIEYTVVVCNNFFDRALYIIVGEVQA